MITFKKYILLQEYTRELMPEIYAALEKYDDPMVGVHFSKGIKERDGRIHPHIGINTKPRHYDPIGIYSFPKNYVLSGGLERNTGFAESPYYYIVKPSPRAKILNLSTMTYDDARELLIKMGIDSPNGESWLDSKSIRHHSKGELKIGHKFWGVLERVNEKRFKNSPWNVLFKDSGYNVLYDEGDGIIHSNEPSQILYLESSAMEVLDQGKQDDSSNKIYSFFIKNFPELRPEKTKDNWGSKLLKLRPDDNSYTLYIYPISNGRIEIKIYSEEDYKNKKEVEIYLKDLNDEFVSELKRTISEMNIVSKEKKEKDVPEVLQNISKRFNIKLKKDERGDWEIKQKYQDIDKDYVITFYIREGNGQIYFVLQKQSMKKTWASHGYNINHVFEYNDEQTPEEIVNMGLNGLKESADQEYKESAKYYANKTIEFLRRRVFGL